MDDDLTNNSSNTNQNNDDSQILPSNTGNSDEESRAIQDDLSNLIFGGAQGQLGTIGPNNDGFTDESYLSVPAEDNDDSLVNENTTSNSGSVENDPDYDESTDPI